MYRRMNVSAPPKRPASPNPAHKFDQCPYIYAPHPAMLNGVIMVDRSGRRHIRKILTPHRNNGMRLAVRPGIRCNTYR
jgi:hypothetical protein